MYPKKGLTAVPEDKSLSPRRFSRFSCSSKSLLNGFFLAALTAISVSCESPVGSNNEESTVQAFSNRPQQHDRFVAIIKLPTPSLLQKASKDPTTGVVSYPSELKKKIEDEQEQMISSLKAISSEIKVITRYRLVLNGISIYGPKAFEEKIRGISGISYVENNQHFDRLETLETSPTITPEDLATNNSSSFIGAYKIRDLLKAPNREGQLVAIDGNGIRVGVIDTGIDYTHLALGGAGTENSYNQQNKDSLSDGGFPNGKVIGGYDFVGTQYDSASPRFEQHIPLPDADPIDEGGHGTHVAGTIAGIGDGKETYDGVAKGAALYALKVFGAKGSTSDWAVIAALEYAADPNSDLDLSDRLDVVNLSLGSDYGTPHVLYGEAIKNLTIGDVFVAASAGNSGNKPNIVGAPSTSEDSLSVAASVDQMSHNWQFRAVEFLFPQGRSSLTEAVEASVAKPITDDHPVSGPIVYLGTAATELSPEEKQAVKGNVALIDRGGITFAEKIQRASLAGAIGVIVANNQPGDPFTMGGDGEFDLPAIMITQALGQEIKDQLKQGIVTINFVTSKKIEKPELIDTLTGFSSRGPRSFDGLLKPEIAAPGANIISAKMGAGNRGIKLSGTSMAAPHMAGVIALLKQKYPLLTVSQLKSLVISTARSIGDKFGAPYPVAYAGAGRVQAYEAALAPLTLSPSTLSLGELSLEGSKTVKKNLELSNISGKDLTFNLSAQVDEGLVVTFDPQLVSSSSSVTLKAGETKNIPLTINVRAQTVDTTSAELDGMLLFKGSDGSEQKIPILAVVNPFSRIQAENLRVYADSELEASDALATLTLKNPGKFKGQAMLFNELDFDARKSLAALGPVRIKSCDLEAAGWRMVTENGENFLEVAVKLYSPVTTWNLCETSILIDGDLDGIADQELLGTSMGNISGNSAEIDQFASVLTNAKKMSEIRRDYEFQYPKNTTQNYTDAVLDKQVFAAAPHSSVSVIRAKWDLLQKTPSGDLSIKVATIGDTSVTDGDDFLGSDGEGWRTLIASGNESFRKLGNYELTSGQSIEVELTKGPTPGNLLVLMPTNPASFSPTVLDQQKVILKPYYRSE
jgi:minor extracellular serine protease Vpr